MFYYPFKSCFTVQLIKWRKSKKPEPTVCAPVWFPVSIRKALCRKHTCQGAAAGINAGTTAGGVISNGSEEEDGTGALENKNKGRAPTGLIP